MTVYKCKEALLPTTMNSAKRKLRTEMTFIETANKTLEADLKKFANYAEIVERLKHNKKDQKIQPVIFTFVLTE